MILYTGYLHSQNRVISLCCKPLMPGSHLDILKSWRIFILWEIFMGNIYFMGKFFIIQHQS